MLAGGFAGEVEDTTQTIRQRRLKQHVRQEATGAYFMKFLKNSSTKGTLARALSHVRPGSVCVCVYVYGVWFFVVVALSVQTASSYEVEMVGGKAMFFSPLSFATVQL